MLREANEKLDSTVKSVNVEACLRGIVEIGAEQVVCAVLVNVGFVTAERSVDAFHKLGITVTGGFLQIVAEHEIGNVVAKVVTVGYPLVAACGEKKGFTAGGVVVDIIDFQQAVKGFEKMLLQ